MTRIEIKKSIAIREEAIKDREEEIVFLKNIIKEMKEANHYSKKEIKVEEKRLKTSEEILVKQKLRLKELEEESLLENDIEISKSCLLTMTDDIKNKIPLDSFYFILSLEQIICTIAPFFDKNDFCSRIDRSKYSEEQIEKYESLIDSIEKYK